MTTRPTDEEIRAMASSCEQAACGEMNPYGSDLFATARFLHAHIAERQAARDGVTDEMVMAACKSAAMYADQAVFPDAYSDEEVESEMETMRIALQSIAKTITSVSDALNFLEEWALSGGKLSGDDVQRFHATVERIAPVEQSARVPDEKSEVWVVQDETGCPIYCASYAQACHEHINDAINEHGIEEACAWKVIHYENSTSPQPQQAVPDDAITCPGCLGRGTFIGQLDGYDDADCSLCNGAGKIDQPTAQNVLQRIVALADAEPFRSIGHVIEHDVPDARAALCAAPAYNGRKEG